MTTGAPSTTNARWQIRPASSTASRSDRSVLARSLLRRIVLRGVEESVPVIPPGSLGLVACLNSHNRSIVKGHFCMVQTPTLPLTLDRDSPMPLAVQLAEELRAAAGDGRLRSGDRLPSTRALAQQLKVS